MIFRISQKAFSLVEIMVAIAIVAIIAAIGASSLSAIQKTGRDTQRQADLRAIQAALQQYYADVNKYPGALTSGSALNDCTGRTTDPVCVPSKTYLSKVPADPFGVAYYYRPVISATRIGDSCSATVGTCHYYLLCTKMESPPTGSSCPTSSAGDNFQITPL